MIQWVISPIESPNLGLKFCAFTPFGVPQIKTEETL